MQTKRENENLQTVIETLKQQNRNLQIEKDTEVEALSQQVGVLACCSLEQSDTLSLSFQVSSLTARAANTQNQQLALIQEENKKLISEKTVLQTQVWKYFKEVKLSNSKPIQTLIFRSQKLIMKRSACHRTCP